MFTILSLNFFSRRGIIFQAVTMILCIIGSVGVQAIMSYELLSISILYKGHGGPFSEANESDHLFSEEIFTALAISKVLPEGSSCIVYKSI